MISDAKALAKAEALTKMAIANMQALVKTIMTTINAYGDWHPIMERGFIANPQVQKLWTADQDIAVPVIWASFLEGSKPVVVSINPLTKTGVADWDCSCGGKERGEPCCEHVVLALHAFQKKLKAEADAATLTEVSRGK